MNNLTNKLLNFEEVKADDAIFPYIIFYSGNGTYGINTKHIISIEEYRGVTYISNKPYGVRGISYYKEEAINLFDLRVIFGFPSVDDEIENVINLKERIIDHEEYVNALEISIQNNTPFHLTTDSHKCKLGRWIDSYHPRDEKLKATIEKLKEPHTKLHETAATIIQMMKSEHFKNAEETFETVKNVYKKDIISNLELLQKQLLEQTDETVIILNVENKKCGIIVDGVETVEYIRNIQFLPENLQVSKYIRELAFRAKSEDILLLVECSVFR